MPSPWAIHAGELAVRPPPDPLMVTPLVVVSLGIVDNE